MTARLVTQLSVLACLLVLGAGCGSGRTSPTSESSGAASSGDDEGGPPAGWPSVLLARAGEGPALYAGSDPDAPAFGYLSEGVRLRLDSRPENGRILVTVGGSIVVHAWVPISRMMAYTSQRGRIDGTPIFLGANDPIGLVGIGDGGAMQVELRARLGREGAPDIGPFSGSVPLEWLIDRPAADGDDGLDPGTPMRLPAGEVGLYDRPNGSVIVTLPALDPPLTVVSIRERNGWHGVRVGVGPFLVGYVHVEMEPSSIDALGTRPAIEAPGASDGTPARVAMEEDGTLVRVESGTRIRFYGEEVARLRADAWGRELSRDGEEVDVFLAVDDGVAVRGIVPADEVTAAPAE